MDENDSIRLFEEIMGAAGKKRKVPVETEAFKFWLAQVGRERMEEGIDPEQAVVPIGSSRIKSMPGGISPLQYRKELWGA